jgi:hypothetical protein
VQGPFDFPFGFALGFGKTGRLFTARAIPRGLVRMTIGRRLWQFLSSLWDSVPVFEFFPGLTSWAILCRRYAA